MNSLINKLTGTGVAIITPFKKNQEVDFDALSRTINFVIDNGVEYIVTLGTTGETPTLTKKEQREIVDLRHKQGQLVFPGTFVSGKVVDAFLWRGSPQPSLATPAVAPAVAEPVLVPPHMPGRFHAH